MHTSETLTRTDDADDAGDLREEIRSMRATIASLCDSIDWCQTRLRVLSYNDTSARALRRELADRVSRLERHAEPEPDIAAELDEIDRGVS